MYMFLIENIRVSPVLLLCCTLACWSPSFTSSKLPSPIPLSNSLLVLLGFVVSRKSNSAKYVTYANLSVQESNPVVVRDVVFRPRQEFLCPFHCAMWLLFGYMKCMPGDLRLNVGSHPDNNKQVNINSKDLCFYVTKPCINCDWSWGWAFGSPATQQRTRS